MRSRKPALGGLVAAVAVNAAAVAVLLTGAAEEPRPSADELLRQARGFVASSHSVRFSGDGKTEFFSGRSGRQGGRSSSYVNRFTFSGSAADPEGYRVTSQGDGWAAEVLAVDGAVYLRTAERQRDLDEEKWQRVDSVDADRVSGVLRSPTGPQSTFEGLSALRTMLGATRAPRLLRWEGDVGVIAAPVDVSRLGEAGEHLSELDIELFVGDDGRPERIIADSRGRVPEVGALDIDVDYEFSGWRSPLVIAAPAGDEVDATPEIAEEEVAAFRDATLFQPSGIPDRWIMSGASVLAAEHTAEGCEQVELDYTDPDDDEGGYLTLYQLPASCADPEPQPGSSPFAVPPGQGWVTSDPDEGVRAQIQVGDTVVQAQTDLPPEELAVVLGRLTPLDLDTRPGAIPGIGRRRATA